MRDETKHEAAMIGLVTTERRRRPGIEAMLTTSETKVAYLEALQDIGVSDAILAEAATAVGLPGHRNPDLHATERRMLLTRMLHVLNAPDLTERDKAIEADQRRLYAEVEALFLAGLDDQEIVEFAFRSFRGRWLAGEAELVKRLDDVVNRQYVEFLFESYESGLVGAAEVREAAAALGVSGFLAELGLPAA